MVAGGGGGVRWSESERRGGQKSCEWEMERKATINWYETKKMLKSELFFDGSRGAVNNSCSRPGLSQSRAM